MGVAPLLTRSKMDDNDVVITIVKRPKRVLDVPP